MNADAKAIDALQIADLMSYPVWEFTNTEEVDETYVVPVTPIPVADLDNRILGCQIVLANGQQVWARIGNFHPSDMRSTQQFMSLSVERNGSWFPLARYFDVDYARGGPQELATFLGLTVDEVFPISYDFRQYVIGDPAVLAGQVPKEPNVKLSRDERMSLIFR